MKMNEVLKHKTKWAISKYLDAEQFRKSSPYGISLFEDNILLNGGIGALWDLACGLGTPTAYNNANAQIGVGDSTVAADATQTDLQAVTNKAWVGMATGYPSRVGQTVTWVSVFDGNTANYNWNEFAVRNGATALVLLNRKVSVQGTKVLGQIWTIDLQIILS